MDHAWQVILEPEVSAWILDLPDDTYDRVEAAIDMLAEFGPRLGRPLVDCIAGSRHRNMKELRVGSCRILFAFDSVKCDPADRGQQTRQMAKLVPTGH